MLFLYYPKCSTCIKAKKWLESHDFSAEIRDLTTDTPSVEELSRWYQASGLPLKKFFNTSGQVYKAMELKDKLPQLSEDEQLALLASNGMLIKRPILVTEHTVLVGFKEADWEAALLR